MENTTIWKRQYGGIVQEVVNLTPKEITNWKEGFIGSGYSDLD